MATTKHTVSFKGNVTPTKTKFLTPKPIKMDFSGELDLDESDASKIKTIQNSFQSEMSKRLKNQLGHLNTWLKEKDALIAKMVEKHDAIEKFGFPMTVSDAERRAANVKAAAKIATEIKDLESDYAKIVNDWADNARQQQGLISLMTCVQKARAKTISNKAWRVRTGLAIKAVLLVATVALSIAAIVLTAGTTAPIFVGLASAGLAVSGIAGFADIGKKISENAVMEKKILTNVQKDVKKIEDALKPVKGANTAIAKHITELQNVMKVRADTTKSLELEIKKKKAEIGGYEKSLNQVQNDPNMQKEVASRQMKISSLKAQIKGIEKKIAGIKADNVKAQDLLDQLTSMNVEIDKLSGTSSSTVGGNLKARFTSLDGWTELGSDVGGLTSAISGAHS